MIEAFTGTTVSTRTILDNINHPRNTFNVQTDARDSFHKLMWGIEAVEDNGRVNNFPQALWICVNQYLTIGLTIVEIHLSQIGSLRSDHMSTGWGRINLQRGASW
jgi:hypothetical protein